jgi:hypothetical protein
VGFTPFTFSLLIGDACDIDGLESFAVNLKDLAALAKDWLNKVEI